MKKQFTWAALLAVAIASNASAQAIVGATSVTGNAGSLPLSGLINQSGLSSNYTSGVTDFASYTSSTTACYYCSAPYDLHELGSGTPIGGSIVFHFSAMTTLDAIVLWNQAGSASITSFSLNAGSGFFGTYLVPPSSQNFPQAAQVYSFAAVTTQDLEFRVNTDAGYQAEWRANEVAFEEAVETTPEPASLALIGTGLIAVGAIRRRKRSN